LQKGAGAGDKTDPDKIRDLISAIDRAGSVAYCYHALQHPLGQFGVKITQIFEFSRKSSFPSWPP